MLPLCCFQPCHEEAKGTVAANHNYKKYDKKRFFNFTDIETSQHNLCSTDDVKKFVKFVRRFGMRPTVRSSGHDYIGRSSGSNTCNLSFEKFKERTVNLNDPESTTGASVRASSGNSWLDLYKEVSSLL